MNRLMTSALGEIPFDLILKNAQFVNVHTEEIYPADLGITNGRVAHVTQPGEPPLTNGPEYNCRGRFLTPALIDTHVHLESSMMTPANFARSVIPKGVGAVLADPHEICNVLGLEGLDFCIRASRDILLKVFLAAPSCVPSVPGVESNKMPFNAPEIAEMLACPEVVALGEVMDYPGVIRRDPRMMAILEEAEKSGKLVQGHVVDVPPRALSAYMAAGVRSDHETRTLEDALMKLRAGMVLECRYGSNAQNVPVEAKALARLNYPVNATLCTDDREPDDLLRLGQVDEALRQAVRHGVPAIKAVQMATRNASLFLGLPELGTLRAGSRADIVLVDSLEEFRAAAVFIDGRLVAEDGVLAVAIPEPDTGFENRNTMNVRGELKREDFLIPVVDGKGNALNVISFLDGDPFATTLKVREFPVKDGVLDVSGAADCVVMAVVERHNATGNIGIAPAENIGLTRGAVAGTVGHDSHNLFVFGKNPDDMLTAARRLVEIGGGFIAVDGRRVLAEVALPVCGLMSLKPAEELAREMEELKKAVNGLGVAGGSPVHMLTWFSLAVLPEVRLTDLGLLDTVNQRILPLYVG